MKTTNLKACTCKPGRCCSAPHPLVSVDVLRHADFADEVKAARHLGLNLRAYRTHTITGEVIAEMLVIDHDGGAEIVTRDWA
jgi:hypothetical protein